MGTAVTKLEILPDYQLKLSFVNGSEAVINMSRRVRTPRFGCLSEPNLFAKACLDHDEVIWDAGDKTISVSVNELLDSMQLD